MIQRQFQLRIENGSPINPLWREGIMASLQNDQIHQNEGDIPAMPLSKGLTAFQEKDHLGNDMHFSWLNYLAHRDTAMFGGFRIKSLLEYHYRKIQILTVVRNPQILMQPSDTSFYDYIKEILQIPVETSDAEVDTQFHLYNLSNRTVSTNISNLLASQGDSETAPNPSNIHSELNEIIQFYYSYILGNHSESETPEIMTQLGFEKKDISAIVRTMFGSPDRVLATRIGHHAEFLQDLLVEKYKIFKWLATNKHYQDLEEESLISPENDTHKVQLEENIQHRLTSTGATISDLDNYLSKGIKSGGIDQYDRFFINKQALLIANCKSPEISKLFFDVFNEPNTPTVELVSKCPALFNRLDIEGYFDLLGVSREECLEYICNQTEITPIFEKNIPQPVTL